MNAQTQREIGEAWELFNAAFRQGFADCMARKPNAGDENGTPWQKGLHRGWKWAHKRKPLPKDPMWKVLGCERLFTDPFK